MASLSAGRPVVAAGIGAPRDGSSTAQGAIAEVAVQQSAGPDPYFPDNGDSRYRVHRYELTLDYRPGPNR
ncbi:M1 family peptidase, partial [Streptomyces sp. NPDC002172]